jgi:hypothetical protein
VSVSVNTRDIWLTSILQSSVKTCIERVWVHFSDASTIVKLGDMLEGIDLLLFVQATKLQISCICYSFVIHAQQVKRDQVQYQAT